MKFKCGICLSLIQVLQVKLKSELYLEGPSFFKKNLTFTCLKCRNIEYHIFGTFVQQIMLLLIGFLTFFFELGDFAVRYSNNMFQYLSTFIYIQSNCSGPYNGEFDSDVGDCNHSCQYPVHSACHPIPQND